MKIALLSSVITLSVMTFLLYLYMGEVHAWWWYTFIYPR